MWDASFIVSFVILLFLIGSQSIWFVSQLSEAHGEPRRVPLRPGDSNSGLTTGSRTPNLGSIR